MSSIGHLEERENGPPKRTMYLIAINPIGVGVIFCVKQEKVPFLFLSRSAPQKNLQNFLGYVNF